MGHFRQYRPSFVESDEPLVEFDFATADELLTHPVLVGQPRDAGFSHFAYNPRTGHVLAIYDGAQYGLVVGTVSVLGNLTLPLARWLSA